MVLLVFAVNKMTFCQLDESKKRLSIKGEYTVAHQGAPLHLPNLPEKRCGFFCPLGCSQLCEERHSDELCFLCLLPLQVKKLPCTSRCLCRNPSTRRTS